MTQIKVSSLPAADALDGTEKVMVVQGGVSKRATAGDFGNFKRDHAAIAVVDGAYAQSIPNGSTAQKLTHFAQAGGMNSHADGMVSDRANNQLIAGRDGHYLVTYQLSFTCGTNNVRWEAYAYAGGVRVVESGAVSKLGTGADAQCISGVALLELAQGQAIDLRVYHDNGGAVNLTLIHASLVALFMHD